MIIASTFLTFSAFVRSLMCTIKETSVTNASKSKHQKVLLITVSLVAAFSVIVGILIALPFTQLATVLIACVCFLIYITLPFLEFSESFNSAPLKVIINTIVILTVVFSVGLVIYNKSNSLIISEKFNYHIVHTFLNPDSGAE